MGVRTDWTGAVAGAITGPAPCGGGGGRQPGGRTGAVAGAAGTLAAAGDGGGSSFRVEPEEVALPEAPSGIEAAETKVSASVELCSLATGTGCGA
jgi:hypothetical protein